MKTALKVMAGVCAWATGVGLHGANIASWDFNSVPPDSSTATGSILPSVGLGVRTVLGVAETFAPGSTNDAGADNTALSSAGFPSRTAGNKTAGLQFNVSTRGYSNIVVAYDQRNSASASKYARFQYSIDGAAFVDFQVISMPSANLWHSQRVDLSGIPAVNNNREFAFRILSEFEFTATDAGTNGYLATQEGSSYATSGTIRLDLMNISGEAMNPANQPPSISIVPNLVTIENMAIINHPFVIGDGEAAPEELSLRASSSNTNLIPAANVVFGGLDFDRTMTITPASDQFGSSLITVSVSDPEGLTTNTSFQVTVTAANVPPTISAIAHQKQVAGEPSIEVPFTVGDAETAPGDLVVSAQSANPDLLPVSGIVFSGNGANRSMRLEPAAGRAGTALVTLAVVDEGGRGASVRFVFMATPGADVLLWETFEYGAGSLVTNSAGFWRTHSGTTGQVQVLNGEARVTSSQSEDAHALFPDGAVTNGVIYASFNATFTSLPSSAGEYFAHWNGSSFRGRIFAKSENAAAGSFRLAIANGSATVAEVPTDLSLDTRYLVVIRYEIETASSTLWVNPEAASDEGVTATDAAPPVPVAAFGLRQASGAGTALIDNLKVARTFAEVVGDSGGGVVLDIVQGISGVEISWPQSAAGFRLEGSASLRPGEWTDVTDVPVTAGDRMIVRPVGITGHRFFRLVR